MGWLADTSFAKWRMLRAWAVVLWDIVIQRRRLGLEQLSFLDSRPVAGWTVVVTGANTGIGFETARLLVSGGAYVIIACRSLEKGERAKLEIEAEFGEGARGTVSVKQLDLGSQSSVREFARSLVLDRIVLNALVLNAGVLGVPLRPSEDGVPETHFAVNHVSHALLTLLLAPHMERGARVVSVSSITYRMHALRLDDLEYLSRAYDSFEAYANSKLCNIAFSRSLARRVVPEQITFNAVHPGEVFTDISRNYSAFIRFLYRTIVGPVLLLTPALGAVTSVCATAAPHVHGVTGALFLHGDHVITVSSEDCPRDLEDKVWHDTLKWARITSEELEAFETISTSEKR